MQWMEELGERVRGLEFAMNSKVFLLLAALLVAPLASGQVATVTGSGSGHQITQCAERELAAITAVISASDIIACFGSPDVARSSTSTRSVSWNVEGPDIPVGGVAAFTFSTISATGCSMGSWTSFSEILSAGTGATAYATVTMSSNECNGYVKLVVTAAAVPVTLATFVFGFNIYVEQTSFSNALSGGVTVTDDANGWALTGIPTPPSSLTLAGTLGVDLVDDTTADGSLTVDVADDSTADGLISTPVPGDIAFNNSTFSTIFPDEFDVNARFPGEADNPGFDFWAGVVFWLILLGFFLYQGWWFAAGFAMPGLLDAVFPTQIPDDMSLYLTLCLLGVVLEVAAHKFSFGHWRTRNSRPSGA